MQGQYNHGLQACIVVTTKGGDALTEAMLRASPHLAQHALAALSSIHQHGILHGGVDLCNFLASPDRQGVCILDFASTCLGDVDGCASEHQAIEGYLSSLWAMLAFNVGLTLCCQLVLIRIFW